MGGMGLLGDGYWGRYVLWWEKKFKKKKNGWNQILKHCTILNLHALYLWLLEKSTCLPKKNTKNLNWEKIIIEGDRNYKYIVDENKNKIKMAQISSMWGTRGTKENRIQSKLLSQKNWTISPIQINVPNIGTGVTYLS